MEIKKYKVGIIGTGGIGGLLAILLTLKNKEVFCKNSLNSGNKKKFFLKSKFFGNKTTYLKFNNKIFKNYDLIILSTKYPDLKKTLKFIDHKTNKNIISLLNGINHIDLLKKKFKSKFIVSNIGKVVSYKKKNNMIIHNSNFSPEITISNNNKSIKQINLIKEIFKTLKIKIIIKKNENLVIWNKLIRINAISAVTAFYNQNLGKIRNDDKKNLVLQQVLQETLNLMKKKKIKLSFASLMKEIQSLPNNLTTSMQRDLKSKKNSEIDTILGGILKEAKKENIILKLNEKIYKYLKQQ